VRLFERALNEEGWMSRLGGDIQLWLALAYQVRQGCRGTQPCHKIRLVELSNGVDCHAMFICRQLDVMQIASTCTKR
jgi:hypothetical protein